MGTQYDRGVLAVTPNGITPGEFARMIEANTNINLRSGMPGHVLAWRPPVAAGVNSKPAFVDVQPHFIFTQAINSPDELTDEDKANGWTLLEEAEGYTKQKALPAISNVPVHYPGSSKLSARGPIAVGECGWIKIADRSIDKWIQTGGPVDPGVAQFHDLSDAIFEPGLRYGTISVEIADDRQVFGPEDGSAALEFIDPVPPLTAVDVTLSTSGETLTLDANTQITLGLTAVTQALARVQSLQNILVAAISQAALLAVPNDGGKIALQQLALILGGLPPGNPATAITNSGTTKVQGE